MRRIECVAAFILVLILVQPLTLLAQEPVPTLVPPTLVPSPDTGSADALLTESAVGRIQRDGRVRVGILYNAPPFGELNIRGTVTGFDAELARSIADAWSVELELLQVTRQTAVDALQTGQIDLLVAAQVHQREMDAQVEFSQTYFVGSQAMMVRADDGAASLADMANRRVGVVTGADSEQAVSAWLQRTGLNVAVQSYLTLDRAYVALAAGQVDGVVDKRFHLIRVATQPELVRILDEPVTPEPYAIALRRQDVNLRDLVDRTLQYLVQSGKMVELYQAQLPGVVFAKETIPLWTGIGEEAPQPSQYPTEIVYPAQYTLPRVLNSGTVRVAGVTTLPDDAPESQRRFEQLNRSLIEQMAARWGVTVEYIPDSAANALDLVASGQADLAVGVHPDWGWTDRVDFTGPYLLHGQRLLVKQNSNIESFIDLRGGKWVAIASNEPEMEDRAVELATSVNARIQVYFTREQDIAFAILVETNADVAFGDSLKLIPQVQANAEDLKLTQREDVDSWYSRSYVTFAVPRNDLDFRLLVEYSLQELVRDGTLNTLLLPVMLPDEIPAFEIWPGPSDYMGLSLAG